LGTIFRVTFTMFYRRIWNIVGKYSILCCDTEFTHGYRPGAPMFYVSVCNELREERSVNDEEKSKWGPH
jgi:hypothetical protein